MGNSATLISRAFWILFTLEAIGYAALMLWSGRGPYKGWGPEGPVGGGVILIGVPILLGIPLAVVLIGRSTTATLCGLVFVSWPVVTAIVGPINSAVMRYQSDSRLSGDAYFLRPTQRKLAHALQAHDAESVRALLRDADDLNVEHRGMSLFQFGMANLDHSPGSVEIVKAMLAAGANPTYRNTTRQSRNILLDAMSAGPAVTEMILQAGADPNRRDGDQPLWWSVLYDTSEQGRETLAVLLNHGADLTLRDGVNGSVGRAASLKNWRGVWLLMERGAAWRDEAALDEPIPAKLEYDLKERRSQHWEIPEEMEKIRAAFREASG
jgi:hypothetical protein